MLRDEVADQLVYATTRIAAVWEQETKLGTGFFMIQENEYASSKFGLITNKHVVEGAKEIILYLVLKNASGFPDDSNHINLKINNVQEICQYHPDPCIDVCLINLGNQFAELKNSGYDVYYKQISTSMTVNQNGLESLTPIEDVIMIGYPNGIMDEINYKPVVRSGITATDLRKDYNGKKEFMIDIACFPGSSGSPVFLRKQGLEKAVESKNVVLAIKPQYAFLGLLYAGPTISIDGKIVIRDIPTNALPVAEVKTMMNLGCVIKASKVIDLFENK